MFYQLPPVGNRICLSRQPFDEAVLHADNDSGVVRFYQSGTASLAVSIAAAIKCKRLGNPEVILPAYGCPDLVSAAVYAGARPILVDLEPDRPWMDLEQVAACLTSETAAVVATSLCGVSERIPELREITDPASVTLIEDSAQRIPGGDTKSCWQGDLVILSFGRGKPVNLLGGGVVLCRDVRLAEFLPVLAPPAPGLFRCLPYRLKVSLYNQLISPRLFWLLRILPFLNIGETLYNRLERICPMDGCRRDVLTANYTGYTNRDLDIQAQVSRMLAGLASKALVDLPVVCETPVQQSLLRYPLLVESELRGQLLKRLDRNGLGASTLYPDALTGIKGARGLLSGQGPFPEAERFASRFLTLPTHEGVRPADIQTAERDFRFVLG